MRSEKHTSELQSHNRSSSPHHPFPHPSLFRSRRLIPRWSVLMHISLRLTLDSNEVPRGSLRVSRRPVFSARLASAAISAALVLGGCDTDSVAPSGRANAPLSDKMTAELESKQM